MTEVLGSHSCRGWKAFAPSPWWKPCETLEGTIKSSFGFVPHLSCRLSDTCTWPFHLQKPCRQLQAPTRQVLHRRDFDVVGKAVHENRPRQADRLGQPVQRPGFRRAGMQQPQRLANMGITEVGKPAARLLRQRSDVPAQHLDEHQLAQLGQDRLAPGRWLLASVSVRRRMSIIQGSSSGGLETTMSGGKAARSGLNGRASQPM
jgi:hypothetical protein